MKFCSQEVSSVVSNLRSAIVHQINVGPAVVHMLSTLHLRAVNYTKPNMYYLYLKLVKAIVVFFSSERSP